MIEGDIMVLENVGRGACLSTQRCQVAAQGVMAATI
jgi:hypothetical protein